jgi:uncharacterized protein DUF3892
VAERHRVRCVKKADGGTPDARIARIGGTNAVGVNWRLTQAEAIQAIEARRWDFYVENAPGPPVDVIVATTGTGAKYLKTTADGDEPSGLLALPEC